MDNNTGVKPLSDFVQNTKAHVEALKASHQPEILTVNGEAVLVVQDAAAYEKTAALADQARQDARLQTAMSYFRKEGSGMKAADAFGQLDAKYF